jgi:hypothetical protein
MHHGKSQAILAFVQLMNLFLLLQLSDKAIEERYTLERFSTFRVISELLV